MYAWAVGRCLAALFGAEVGVISGNGITRSGEKNRITRNAYSKRYYLVNMQSILDLEMDSIIHFFGSCSDESHIFRVKCRVQAPRAFYILTCSRILLGVIFLDVVARTTAARQC